MLLSARSLSILTLGLWLLCSLFMSQEICSSPGTLPAPRLFLDRLSARRGDTAMLSCLVPCGIPVTRVVFCKDGKEISVQPKGGNTLVYDSAYPVSKESAGAFSCRYQFKDDNNQENNSLPSEPRHLHVTDGEVCGVEALLQGPAIQLWVWILRSALVLLLLASAPIITCILRKRPITQYDPEGSVWNGREEEEGEISSGEARSESHGISLTETLRSRT
ncbi:uncharacterized protein ACDP82_020280 isoform 2-T2 [Pangshura tecta]